MRRAWPREPAGSPASVRTQQPAIAAVQRSATALGATLTPDDIAIRRAGDSMKRLDAMVETMRRDGTSYSMPDTKPDAI